MTDCHVPRYISLVHGCVEIIARLASLPLILSDATSPTPHFISEFSYVQYAPTL